MVTRKPYLSTTRMHGLKDLLRRFDESGKARWRRASSGILKKLFNGEKLNFGITEIKLKSNFDYADLSYDVHIYSNYTLIALISLHILAALLHTLVFKDDVIKRIT